jgi:polar amino acid transport system substrate-binding protein
MARGSARTLVIALCATVAAGALLLAAGCGELAKPKVEPKLPDTALVTPGTLTVAVDMTYPPFAYREGTKQAGLDLDVAAAVADELGLKVAYVDYRPKDLAGLIASRQADVAMGALTVKQGVAAGGTLAGIYAWDAPALFTPKPETATVDALAVRPVGAQKASPSYWILASLVGDDAVAGYPTLAEAFKALGGQVEVVGADALVGAYIARDSSASIAATLAPAAPVAIIAPADKREVADAVRTAVDALAAKGVLATLQRKWVGDAVQRVAPAPSRPATSGATSAAP